MSLVRQTGELRSLMRILASSLTGRAATGQEITGHVGQKVILRGWVYRLRVHAKSTFLVLKDCSGVIQCVMPTNLNSNLHLRLDDCVEVTGDVRAEPRSNTGIEVYVTEAKVLSRAGASLPVASCEAERLSLELQLENRPVVLRNERLGEVFRLQARAIELFRTFLREQFFTEIVTSKLLGSGTEGGTSLFEMRYFDKIAYLAQSPQFYKEQCVAGLERVFETGHVYRAEPHATSRHLTEYYSLDVEMGFIEGPEEIIELERELLIFMFAKLNEEFAPVFESFGMPKLPSMATVPVWEFEECREKLEKEFGRTGLREDLDPGAERQLCQLAEKERGVPAVFVLGFPLKSRPFYTAPRGSKGAAQSFDLLFRGLEITTGGQRLHSRPELEASLRSRGLEPGPYESHLRTFELGMPPHGGFAIGAERLTCQILGLKNVREATLYPRDRNRLTP